MSDTKILGSAAPYDDLDNHLKCIFMIYDFIEFTVLFFIHRLYFFQNIVCN